MFGPVSRGVDTMFVVIGVAVQLAVLPTPPAFDLSQQRASLTAQIREVNSWKHGPMIGAIAGLAGTGTIWFFCRSGCRTGEMAGLGAGSAALGAFSGFVLDRLFKVQPPDYRYEGAIVGAGVFGTLGIAVGAFFCSLSEEPGNGCLGTGIGLAVSTAAVGGITGALFGGMAPRNTGSSPRRRDVPASRLLGGAPP